MIESEKFLKLRENAEHKNSKCNINEQNCNEKTIFMQTLFEWFS